MSGFADSQGRYRTTAGVLAFSLVSGLLIGLAGITGAASSLAVLSLAVLMMLPLRWVFWAAIFSAFYIAGGGQYFLGINKAFWLPYGFGFVLCLRIFIEVVAGRYRGSGIGFLGWSALFFGFLLLFSAAVNTVTIIPFVFSIKSYLFLLPVVAVFVMGILPKEELHKFWQLLPWLMVSQIPAIAAQVLVYVPRRHDPSRWDAIVGLFGGDPMGGGASAAMVFFTIITLLFLCAQYREKLESTPRLVCFGLSALAIILAAEVKAALILLPLSLMVLYRGDILKRPLRFLMLGSVLLSVLAGVLFVYQVQFSDSRTAEAKYLDQYVITALQRQDKAEIDMRTGEMGRGYALQFWWQKHGLDDPLHFVVGHGVGSSKRGGFSGEVAKKYSFDLQRSTAAVLLWETGLLGLVFVLGLIAYYIGRAAILATSSAHAIDKALASAMVPALLIYALGVFYNTDLIDVPPSQMVFLLIVAYLQTQLSRLKGEA